MQVRTHACTRRSLTHTHNEDRAVVGRSVLADTEGVQTGELADAAIVAVLDGLGGHPAGDVASELAARVLAGAEVPGDEDQTNALLHRADTALHDAMRDEPGRFGMGTTVALAAIVDGTATVANVGDATIWRLADGERLEPLSVSDRSAGSAILQCLGVDDGDRIAPHTGSLRLVPGEHLLLASDGLTDVVPLDRIAQTLQADPGAAAGHLLAEVEAAGVPDDVTIVVLETVHG